MCPCWILWLFIPIAFAIGFVHKPTGDRLKLWLSRLIKKINDAEIKLLKGGK